MTTPATHVVLLNASAGAMAGDDPAQLICELFAAHGKTAEVHVLKEGEDIEEAARAAVARSPSVIVAGGGDGTLNAVAGVLIGTGVTFGVLPLGTLNHFAKDLAIPMELKAAVEVVCAGRVQHVDVGRVNGHLFLNNSSLGLYPQVVRRRDEMMQRLGRTKWPAFVWAAWSVLRRYPFLDIRLIVDDKSRSLRTPLLFVGNNSYALDGLKIGARRRLDAGHLSVYVVGHSHRAGLFAMALRALFGRLRQAKDFHTFCTSGLEVVTRRKRIRVATDGEVSWMQSPLDYRLEPKALPVLVPAKEV